MRKILFILAFIPVWVFGQVDNAAIVNVGTGPDTGDGDSLRVAFKKINNNATTTNNALQSLNERLEGLQNYEITITDDGDSLQLRIGSTYVKLATGSSTITDLTPPAISSAEIGQVADDSIIIIYNEVLDTDSVPDVTSWTIYVDEVEKSVTSVAMYSQSIHLKLNTSVDSANSIRGIYTRPSSGRVQDAAGNASVSTPFTITNNTKCTQTSAFAHFRFESSVSDEMGNVTLVNNASYETGSVKIEGTGSASVNAGNVYFRTDEIAFGDLFTISCRWRKYLGSEPWSGTYTVWSWRDESGDGNGLELVYQAASDTYEVISDDGTSTTTATSSAVSYVSGAIASVIVAVDRAAGELKIYHNGSDVTSVGLIQDDFDSSDSIYIGIQKDLTGEFFGTQDDYVIYKDTLSADQASDLYSSVGSAITLGECSDSPTPDADSIIVIKRVSFDNAPMGGQTVKTDLVKADFEALASNFSFIGGEAEVPPVVDDAEFRIDDGDTILRSHYDFYSCCQETNNSLDPPVSGTGMYVEYYNDAARTDYYHGYLFFRVRFASNWEVDDYGGTKWPRLSSVEDHNDSENGWSLGMMSKRLSGDNVMLQWYLYDFITIRDSDGNLIGGTARSPHGNADGPYGFFTSISRGEWHDVCIRFWVGDAGHANGFLELFIDGTLVSDPGGQVTGRYFRRTNDDHPSNNIGANVFEIATFAGGCSESYRMPVTSYMDMDDIVYFYFEDGYSGMPAYNKLSPAGQKLPDFTW